MFAEMTPMLSSLVTVLLSGAETVELVERRPGEPFTQTMATSGVDVLLVRADTVADCGSVLGDIARAAPIGVVAISENGRSATAYRLDSLPVAVSAEGRLDLIGAIALAARQTPKAPN